MVAPPTIIESQAQVIPTGESLSATTYGGTVDLNSLNDAIASAWFVAAVTRLSVEALLVSGTWVTANVIIEGGVDGATWTTIATLTGVGFSAALDVEDYVFVRARTSIVEGGAGVAQFASYGFTPPFDRDKKLIGGPATATDNALVRWDGGDGEAVQDSGWLLNDSDVLTAAGNFNLNSKDIVGARVITSASFLSILSAPGNNAITITGGSNTSGDASDVTISGGDSTGGDGDGGGVTLIAGNKDGTGTEGEIVLQDHGGVDAVKLTSAATPVVEVNRTLDCVASILLHTNNRIGPDATNNLVFVTDTSAVLKINNVVSMTHTDTAHDFHDLDIQNFRHLMTLPFGEQVAKSANSWLKGVSVVQYGTSEGYPMDYDYIVVGASCRLNVTVDTAGDLDARLYIENSVQAAAELTWDSVAGTGFATQRVTGLSIAGSAGDRINVGMFKSDTMTWDDVSYLLWVLVKL